MTQDATREQVAKTLVRWNDVLSTQKSFQEKLQQVENIMFSLQAVVDRIHGVERSITTMQARLQSLNCHLTESFIREGDFYISERQQLYVDLNDLLSFNLIEKKKIN